MKKATRKSYDKNFIITPPFADPTQPYVALPTLKAYLEKNSCPVKILDWNIEGIHDLLKRKPELIKRHKKRTSFLKNKKNKNLSEKLELQKLLESNLKIEGDVRDLQKTKNFYRWESYQKSRLALEKIFEIQSALSFPFDLGIEKCTPLLSPWDEEALEHYIQKEKSPFLSFYKTQIKKFPKKNLGFIGISITFPSQLAESLTLCHLIKKEIPEAFIVLGGAALHQIVSSMKEDDKKYFFHFASALCLYEGEESFRVLHQILPEYKKSRSFELLKTVPNLFLSYEEKTIQTEIKMFDLQKSGPPDYSDLDLKKYLSPSPILLYAPTRGCYWNKCSFCYYGFSQAKTHCYREKSPQEAAKELIFLSKKYKTHHFYISGDVLSPLFAVELAKELKKKKSKIFWSTDLRIERYYTPERCQILYEGGLRAVAFGIESGSNRMLKDVINKGVTKEIATEINKNFYEAKIATAWMTFLHHPKETLNDAYQTLDWIREEQERISLFIIGEFGLTPGSKIYGEAKKFNLEKIYYTAGDFFKLYPLFIEETKDSSAYAKAELGQEIDDLSSGFTLCHYPWAGAISTHHSLLYFLKYGQDFFRRIGPHLSEPKPQAPQKLNEEIARKLSKFLTLALRPKQKKTQLEAPLSFGLLQKFLNEN